MGSRNWTHDSILRESGVLSRALAKKSVRAVLIRRPFSKRGPGWIVLGAGIALYEALWGRHDDLNVWGKLVFAYPIFAALPAALTFYGLRVKALYKVDPNQRGT